MTGASRHLLGIALLAIALALPAAQQDARKVQQDIARAQKDRQAVIDSLERVQKQVARDAQNLDKQQRALRDAEKSVASASADLRDLKQQRAARAAARQTLLDERKAKETERTEHRQELANQLRGAYYMGRNEPLQLLLNQRNSAQMSRMLTYYGYFGRLRATQIEQLNQDVDKIKELTANIESEDAELARLEQQQKNQVSKLEGARKERGQVLASLEKDAKARGAQQAQLQKQKQALDRQLDDLLERLQRATQSTPYDPRAPFAKALGKLSWPVAGSIDVDFGETPVGSTRSSGIEIDARQGAEVRAVYEGEVKFSDYLSGRGYLVILDHGNGFMSMYAHNEQLFRQVGDRVQTGDLIATVGDSGGRKAPGLYFEIRSGVKPGNSGRPVNPHDWFSSKAPPTR
jgi:septal ring factor EnvC (AmiA/AmiB activator)